MIRDIVSFPADIIKLMRQARGIGKSRTLGLKRGALVKAFIAIAFRAAASKRLHFTPKPAVSLFGWTVDYISLQSFALAFNEIFAREQYYFEAQAEEPFIVDCGSNIGASILYFKTVYPRARILGFEPFEQAFEVLRRNIEQNRLQDVTVHKVALAASNGQQRLFYNPANAGSLRMSLLPERIQGGSTSTDTAVLSQFIDQPVTFLKMDIEGLESDVLDELDQAKKLCLIQQMTVEYHHHVQKEVDRLSRILGILERNNFGYHLDCGFRKARGQQAEFQDVMIHAYAKHGCS